MNGILLALALAGLDGRPHLSELQRFRAPAAVWTAWEFRQEHRKWLEDEITIHPYDAALFEWHEDLERCNDVWESLWRAQGFPSKDGDIRMNDPDRQRDYLTRVRDLLGPENWCRAIMPPTVPAWRFREKE